MTIEQRKDYIRQFVSQGVDPDQAYNALYMTEQEIAEVESDATFQTDIRDLRMRVGLGFIQSYHTIIDSQGKPGDHYNRLRSLYPEYFKADGAETRPLDLNLTIFKKRAG